MNHKNRRIKELVRDRDLGLCQTCGQPCYTTGHIAHLIAATKVNIKVYGSDIIDHQHNKAWCCQTKMSNCNDRWNIGNKPMTSLKLVNVIKLYGDQHLTPRDIEKLIKEG